MNSLVILEQRGTVGIIRIDNPPVNALSPAVVVGLAAALDQVDAAPHLDALLLCAHGATFVAGGDIAALADPHFDAATVNCVLARLEQLERPVIALLHGTILGGGLELAMACHYRLAAPGSRFGMPEVRLGLLPGSLGTQRLPRLVGAQRALDMMLGGAPIDAASALAEGLIDALVPEAVEPLAEAARANALLEAGINYALALRARQGGARRTSARSVSMEGLAPDFFDLARARARPVAGGSLAPQQIVRCVEAAVTMDFEAGAALEAEAFRQCLASPASVALRHLFFAQRQAAKIPGLPPGLPVRPVVKVGVLGAGTMGGGIAMNFASAGIAVTLVETSQAALERGLARVRANYEASAAKGRIGADEPARRMALLTGTLDDSALADCDLVIEAVFENLAVKQAVCAKLGTLCKPGAIIASNTSTLDIDLLAQASGRPRDFLGMHFFSPANVMSLLEIVRGEQTSPEVLDTVMRLARKIGKVPVVSGVCYGFIGNRMLEPYMRETDFLLMEGATPAQIDAAIESLGLPMGPCRMLDLAGLDVAANVVIERGKAGALPGDPAYRAVVQEMMRLGRFGQKTGAGYYRYAGRNALPDPLVEASCVALAARFGIVRRSDIGAAEIIERCLYPLMAEGARIVDEGIAYRPGDIDVVYVNGYGFPDYRGGPMHMADQIGLEQIEQGLARYARLRGNEHGYWDCPVLLKSMRERGLRFAQPGSRQPAPSSTPR